MLRDVFYYGKKPNVHPREKPAKDLVDARTRATTDHFWIINEFCDYTGFDWDWDFDFLADGDVWAEEHNNVWPSLHQKDSGTWLCSKEQSEVIIYRADVDPLKRKNEINSNWVILDNIDQRRVDFSWHPDPTEPPYIYKWGCKFFPVELKACLEYHTPGATEIKYMETIVELLPSDCWVENQQIDKDKFDITWRPDPQEQPWIYVWGNKYIDGRLKSTLEYHTPGATEVKYMPELLPVLPEWDRWVILQDVDRTSFDFCWRPDPREPDFIYVFGNDQYDGNIMPTIEYHMPNATERKYINEKEYKAKLLPHPERFKHLEDSSGIDYRWVPDPTAPPYIYAWGNQWNKPEDKISIQYVVEGATEYKYMEERAIRKPCMENWVTPDNVDINTFDYSWEPSPADPPYVYEFGTQWQKTGGPSYVVDGATEIKYIDTLKAFVLPTSNNWAVPDYVDVNSFDFSWHPDATNPPYVYKFGTQWAITGGPTYTVEGATEIKYVDEPIAKALVNMDNWVIPSDIDVSTFDFSWHPYADDTPYVYQFGTQWQKTGGPRYMTPGINPESPTKYIDTRIIKATRLPVKKNWSVLNNAKIADFDYSWHPDTTEEPYIYLFGNNFYPAEEMPTMEYKVPGATQIKYVSDIVAKLAVDMRYWEIPKSVDTAGFDFSWRPNPNDSPYIYQFGTQWQKTGGPRYVVADATEVKYVTTMAVRALPNKDNWVVPETLDISDFDFSWHPDTTESSYIYQFGTQWAPTGGPRYISPGATEIKYVDDPIAKAAPNKTNWIIPNDIDEVAFDFSWHPYADDQPYIYQFGTQWQKTGGPKYIAHGADETSFTKYIDVRILKAVKLPNRDNWELCFKIDETTFDFSWHPDETEEPFIYVFGNNLYSGEVMPTVKYVVKGATRFKYVPDIIATLANDRTNWEIPDGLDVSEFDFSWHPNPHEPAFIYEFGTQWQKTGGPRYIVEGATVVKYIDGSKARRLPSKDNWFVPDNLDESSIDFSWHPDSTEEPYIYHFGTQWNTRGGPEYRTPHATEYKYSTTIIGKTKATRENWNIIIPINEDKFDFSWVPHPEAPPYIYVFGNQWNTPELESTIEYIVPGAVDKKYMHDIKAYAAADRTNWEIVEDIEEFDFSWRPNPTDPDFVYIFGNKWYPGNIMPTVRYVKNNATQEKFVDSIVATLAQKPSLFSNRELIKEFDYSWRPNPKDPPYIYQFGTQWAKTHGPTFIVDGATEVKYVDEVKATILPNMKYWEIPTGFNINSFDFSWHPDATSDPFIYQFGSVTGQSDGPRYVVHNNKGEVLYLENILLNHTEEQVEYPRYYITTTLDALIDEHPNELFWALNPDIEYIAFDFNWRPDVYQAKYIHAFGSKDNINTQTYFVNAIMCRQGLREINYIQDESANLKTKIDMFFVDRGNSESQERFNALKEQYSNIQKTRYLNSWVDTINRCITKSSTKLCWILNSELDYSGFNFDYYPNPWQMKMVHVFGTQWSHWGTTFMVNRETFSEDTKYIKIIEHLSNLNFVKNCIAVATNCIHDVVIIDHGNPDIESILSMLQDKTKKPVNVVKYNRSYLDTFNSLLKDIKPRKEHYLWVCSSVCDYSNFDFSYVCDPFAKDQLHVFPSDKQKFGDTFLIDVNKFKELINDMKLLEDYKKVNFNQHQRVPRLLPPMIVTDADTLTEDIQTKFRFPYALFVTEDNADLNVKDNEPISLWTPRSKNILITSTGGTRVIVPKEAQNYIERELYDYPYIAKSSKLATSKPMDIVFLSNGEEGAEKNWEHLLKVTKGLKNRVTRVDGVNGRVAAYHAGVEASETPWALMVFAKLRANPKFDWNWQPDRLQISKHYIFLAENPVNGLVYGHQGMLAYNKKLTLATKEVVDLDFTLSQPHEVVEMNSGTALFNTDAWSTWRTSFRETLKLFHYNEISPSEDTQMRLNTWLTVAKGDFAEWCLRGAADAKEYYEESKGEYHMLMLSFEWKWLRDYYEKKYSTQ